MLMDTPGLRDQGPGNEGWVSPSRWDPHVIERNWPYKGTVLTFARLARFDNLRLTLALFSIPNQVRSTKSGRVVSTSRGGSMVACYRLLSVARRTPR